jgi:hypothetical protein
MLSTKYRLRVEYICERVRRGEEVKLEDMMWVERLAKANTTVSGMLRKARREVANPEMIEGGLDDFMNKMDIGDPDPSNHVSGFNSVEYWRS